MAENPDQEIDDEIEHLETLNKLQARIGQLEANIQRLMRQIGDPGQCSGCGAPIWWVHHRNGNKTPYTADALNHFADCPEAAKFRKPRR